MTTTHSMEDKVAQEMDVEALTAALAGFLASQVLTLRFLAQEGIVDKDRFLSFLETARDGMAPGIADQRSLVVLNQVINSLRAPADDFGLQ